MAAILYLPGLEGNVQGSKVACLQRAGHDVLAVELGDSIEGRDLSHARQTVRTLCGNRLIDVIVAASRGAALAITLEFPNSPALVLTSPAIEFFDLVRRIPPGRFLRVIHSVSDDVIPLAEAERLVLSSGYERECLVIAGQGHGSSDDESLEALKAAVLQALAARS